MANQAGQKRDRERARLERAAIKRARRQGKLDPDATQETDEDELATDPGDEMSEAEVLERLAALHQSFTNDEIDSDDFQSQRDDLLARLQNIT